MLRSLVAVCCLWGFSTAWAQTPPPVEWQRNLGGSVDELGTSIEPTNDGGYILCGTTFSNNGDVSGNHGNGDIWVVKLSTTGSLQWQRCLGGSQPENGIKALQLSGGGYLVLGSTRSDDGDVIGNHGALDFWLTRLDNNGNLLSQRCYGGSLNDSPADINQTPDGGFIVVGASRSVDGDLNTNAGSTDYWVLKLDDNFDIQWQRTFGGSGGETAFGVTLTLDAGYLVNGTSSSSDGDVSGAFGLEDYWVLKLDTQGNVQWQRACGGSASDYGVAVSELSDGSIFAMGFSDSENEDVSAPLGLNDIWTIRLSSGGQVIGDQTYGGSNLDSGSDQFQTSDGGFIYCGSTKSNDGDIPNNQGLFDGWIFRTDAEGNILWNVTKGGSQSDSFLKITGTNDGGYIAIGQSSSSDGDLIGNHGGGDVWIVKFAVDPVGVSENGQPTALSLYPNPCAGTLYISLPILQGFPVSWQVIDAQGKLAAAGTLVGSTNEVDASALKPGAYNFLLRAGTRQLAMPFVKEETSGW